MTLFFIRNKRWIVYYKSQSNLEQHFLPEYFFGLWFEIQNKWILFAQSFESEPFHVLSLNWKICWFKGFVTSMLMVIHHLHELTQYASNCLWGHRHPNRAFSLKKYVEVVAFVTKSTDYKAFFCFFEFHPKAGLKNASIFYFIIFEKVKLSHKSNHWFVISLCSLIMWKFEYFDDFILNEIIIDWVYIIYFNSSVLQYLRESNREHFFY